jgi:hypothetical protein
MKKVFGFAMLMGLLFGINSVLFAQGEGKMPPPPPRMEGGNMGKRGGFDGRGGGMRGMKRGGRDGGGMHRGGMGISDDELFKLNLTNDQKVKLFDFRKKMFTEREAMMKDRKPGEGMMAGMNPDEMRQLMSAKQLGTLTPEQKTKLDAMEAEHKQMMEKRKTEMDAMKAKMEKSHEEFLNIFTLDQRKQLEQIRAEKMKAMEGRMKEMQEKGGMRKRGMKPDQPKPNM